MSCSHCGAKKEVLQQCGKCLSTLYCSKNCQENDWTNHKLICDLPSETTTSYFGTTRPVPQPTKVKEETIEQITSSLLSNLQAIDSKLKSVQPSDFKQRAKVQDKAYKTAFSAFKKIAVKTGMSTETAQYVGDEIDKFGDLYKDLYKKGLTGDPFSSDPIRPAQKQYDKIFSVVRMSLNIPADTEQEIYDNDMSIVNDMITETSITAASLATKRGEENIESVSNIDFNIIEFFSSKFADAASGAAQVAIRDMVECIWGRKSYTVAYINNVATPAQLKKEHDAMMDALRKESKDGSWSSGCALRLLEAAESIEKSQLEFRNYIRGDTESLTKEEAQIVKRAFLAVEIILSTTLTMYCGYHLYVGWESAVAIRDKRAKAVADTSSNREILLTNKVAAAAHAEKQRAIIKEAQKAHENCTQNATALRTRENVLLKTTDIGFDLQLRLQAAEDLNIPLTKTKWNAKEARAIATVESINNAALMERQDRLKETGVDAWSQATFEPLTTPDVIANNQMVLSRYIRAIQEVPKEEILTWGNDTGKLIVSMAKKNILEERQQINAPGTIYKDTKAALLSSAVDEETLTRRLEIFFQRVNEAKDACDTKSSPELLEDQFALLNVLGQDNRVQKRATEYFISNTAKKLDETETKCSELKKALNTAELVAQPFTDAQLAADQAFENANKTMHKAIEANLAVQSEIDRTNTDPVNFAANAIHSSFNNIWFYMNAFLQSAYYGSEIFSELKRRLVTDDPGVLYSTAFFPSIKDSWDAMLQLLKDLFGGNPFTKTAIDQMGENASKLWMLICVMNLIAIILRVTAPGLIAMFLWVVRKLTCCRPRNSEVKDEDVKDAHWSIFNDASQWKLSAILTHLGKTSVKGGAAGLFAAGVVNAAMWIGDKTSKLSIIIGTVILLATDGYTMLGAALASNMDVADRLKTGLGGLFMLAIHSIVGLPAIEELFGSGVRKAKCFNLIAKGVFTGSLFFSIQKIAGFLMIVAAGGGIYLYRETGSERQATPAAPAPATSAPSSDNRVTTPVLAPSTVSRSRSKSRSRKVRK